MRAPLNWRIFLLVLNFCNLYTTRGCALGSIAYSCFYYRAMLSKDVKMAGKRSLGLCHLINNAICPSPFWRCKTGWQYPFLLIPTIDTDCQEKQHLAKYHQKGQTIFIVY